MELDCGGLYHAGLLRGPAICASVRDGATLGLAAADLRYGGCQHFCPMRETFDTIRSLVFLAQVCRFSFGDATGLAWRTS
jgi:hypothetical protein